MEEEKAASSGKFNLLDWRFLVIGLAVLLVAGGVAYGAARMALSTPGSEKRTEQVKTGPLVKVGEYLVNIADTQGRRFLKTEIVLELTDAKYEKDFTAKLPVVQDRILSFLGSKTVMDLQVEQREKLKEELMQELNTVLGYDQIKKVYFTTFIMQ